MIVPLLLLVASFTWFSHGLEIHKHMTKREIREVFSVDHDAVHKVEYQVVPVFHHRGNKQNAPQLRFSAFDNNIHLFLENNNHFLLGNNTKIFTARRSHNGITYETKYFPKDLQLYHNFKNRAAVALYINENDEVQAQGVVGDDIVIRSIPSRVHKKVKREYPNIHKDDDFQFEHVTHHIVIRSAQSFDPAFDTDTTTPKYGWRPNTRSWGPTTDKGTPKTVDIVYPELVLAVDYATYKMHGLNVKNLAVYMAAFWNAVDLRYREMDKPKIRLNIAALYIPTHPSISLMGNHPVNRCKDSISSIDMDASLKSLGEHFGSKRSSLPNANEYDIVVGITNRDLCRKNDTSGEYFRNGGAANLGGACDLNNDYSAAIVLDLGGFHGVITAAHEVNHSLGSPHDGEESKDVEGGPCPWDDGYIMSFVVTSKNLTHMSHCTKTAIRKFVTSSSSSCLRNVPNVGIPYVKALPGKLLDRDGQCRMSYNLKAYKGHDKDKANSCLMLYCVLEDMTIFPVGTPPADGTSCGHNQICLDGKCVRDSTHTYG